MSSSPSQLSQLGRKPHSYSMLLRSFADQNDQTPKLEEFISRLEEERLKIDAFKRELPLCMQLLTSAVDTSRKQLQACRGNEGPIPVLEEFIPLKTSASETPEMAANISDKASWMTTAQLWSQDSIGTKPQTTLSSPKQTAIGFNVSSKLVLDTKQRNGGAFLPFSKERNMCPSPTLALAACTDEQLGLDHKKFPETENGFSCPNRESCGNKMAVIGQGKGVGNSSSSDGEETNAATIASTNTCTSQTHRKARRCWSPDLHRRFVNALHLLGGSQVATPKQIRELMKVDGLTNDEVKSHLQKYRLHTRRPSPSPQAAAAPAPHLVVLGGIWVPPEYATAAAAAAHSGGQPSMVPTQLPMLRHHSFVLRHLRLKISSLRLQHLRHHFTTKLSATNSSCSSPLHRCLAPLNRILKVVGTDLRALKMASQRVAAGKARVVRMMAERKGRAALREEGEESNGSKF